MQLRQLNINDVIPFVRYVQKHEVPNSVSSKTKFINAYDHRLFYVRHGSGRVEFTDRIIPLSRGDLVIWPSGWQYRLEYIHGEEPLILLGCNFDYTQDNAGFSYPIPPDTVENFHADGILENVMIAECPHTGFPFCLHNMQYVEAELEEMLRESRNQLKFTSSKLSAMLLKILCTAFRCVMAEDTTGRIISNTIDEIIEYIHLHYSEDLTNRQIGDAFKYHPNYINTQMVRATGKSLHQYLISYRLNQAIELLTTTDKPVSQIAMDVGFNDIPHFIRLFHNRTGKTPHDYRRNG